MIPRYRAWIIAEKRMVEVARINFIKTPDYTEPCIIYFIGGFAQKRNFSEIILEVQNHKGEWIICDEKMEISGTIHDNPDHPNKKEVR